MDSPCGAQLHLSHQVFGHLLLDLDLVFQGSLTESPVDEDLKRLPEAEVVFVETYCLLGLFLSLQPHGGYEVKSEERLVFFKHFSESNRQ